MPAIGVENSVVFPLGRKIKSHKDKVSNIRHYSGQETRTSWASGLFQNLLRGSMRGGRQILDMKVPQRERGRKRRRHDFNFIV